VETNRIPATTLLFTFKDGYVPQEERQRVRNLTAQAAFALRFGLSNGLLPTAPGFPIATQIA
jgi:hypothetical protein